MSISSETFCDNSRHYFPGNNTPKGFFSYYRYILPEEEASRFFCIKGGPGTGKSGFMRGVAAEFYKNGESIDYLHCSSDPDSLDGIILKDRKIAFVDGTAPHALDPALPGAVGSIINLGDYWDAAGLGARRKEIAAKQKQISNMFRGCYRYLAAAGSLQEMLEDNYRRVQIKAYMKELAENIAGSELKSFGSYTGKAGINSSFFATAFTPEGKINYAETLLKKDYKVYCLDCRTGMNLNYLMELIRDEALVRGHCTESFYDPLNPEGRVEYLLVPSIKLALLSNRVPLRNINEKDMDITGFDADDIFPVKDAFFLEKREEIKGQLNLLCDYGIEYLRRAKALHDELEEFYVQFMNFKKIDALMHEKIENIYENVL